MSNQKTEKEWGDKGGGRGPGQTEKEPGKTTQIDRFDWSGNRTEKSFK